MGLVAAILISSLPEIAIGAAGAAAVGTSIYSANESAKQGKKANEMAAEQQGQQQKLLEEAKATTAADKLYSDQVAARDAAKNKQKTAAVAAGAQGRASTIQTSPLGVTGAAAPTQGKTILGA